MALAASCSRNWKVMIRSKSNKKSTSTLIKELDGLFSEWLRRGNADSNGKCECYICGYKARWQEMQAGHFMDRMYMVSRFDVSNVYVVCEQCNCFDPDHKDKFRAAIIQKRGEDVVTVLEMAKHSLKKWMAFELQELIDYIKLDLKKLKK